MTLNRQYIMGEVKDYIFITLGLLLYTFGYMFFLVPYKIVTGGVTGAASIVYYATGIHISYTYFFINVVLLAAALKVLGFRFMMKTIYATFMLSFLLKVAQDLITGPDGNMYCILGEGQVFMSLIIGCSMTGTSLAIVFMNNGSTGGTDIIAAIVNKFYHLTLGQVLILVDIFIISSTYPVFLNKGYEPIEAARILVTGLSAMVMENFMLDYVMNARRQSVQFLIFSRKYQEIANAIGTQLDLGVTILDGHGWYTGNDVKVLCVLARKGKSQSIFRLIKMIDPNAFVSQSAVIGVFGEGFDEMKVRLPKKKRKEDDSIRNEQQA